MLWCLKMVEADKIEETLNYEGQLCLFNGSLMTQESVASESVARGLKDEASITGNPDSAVAKPRVTNVHSHFQSLIFCC